MPKFEFPRCEAIPQANHEVSFRIDGAERLRWHYGPNYPRPFLYPLIGPSGKPLTRMGHPGAPDHDHHRSIWFAHSKVLGIDFWSDKTKAVIRQKQWLAYQDGANEAVMACLLGWYDGHDPKELMEQETIIALRPGDDKEVFVEIQFTLKPTADTLELQKTNFGFLAVRMAKSLSIAFGGGKLKNSEFDSGEEAIFGKRAKWVDSSGPVSPDVTEGITFFDHEKNYSHPCRWHVREDGWMGASFNNAEAYTLSKMKPLTLRYLLHAHTESVAPKKADGIGNDFGRTAPYEVVKSTVKHTAWEVRRKS